jgi:hypothetical protein
VGMGLGLEIVGNVSAVVVLDDGAEVRAVLKAALDGERGDVLGARSWKIGFFSQGRVDILRLLDVAHGVGGARTPSAPAAAALASRVALGGDRRAPVCNDSGSTLF